ncbi:hypothetical protein EVAR_70932_1 [Eumeta japonica]|uniref:Uncharacterized protein n=1 Tax=Eumeta variegata TaxID=151549 RepID=A0A4C1T065_EUMVA|nr:hypothetical protein EVAR_70932_1 [Eumeta japonica]
MIAPCLGRHVKLSDLDTCHHIGDRAHQQHTNPQGTKLKMLRSKPFNLTQLGIGFEPEGTALVPDYGTIDRRVVEPIQRKPHPLCFGKHVEPSRGRWRRRRVGDDSPQKPYPDWAPPARTACCPRPSI